MKKLLLGLGTLATIVAPVAAVVACGSTTEIKPKGAEPVATATLEETKAIDKLQLRIEGPKHQMTQVQIDEMITKIDQATSIQELNDLMNPSGQQGQTSSGNDHTEPVIQHPTAVVTKTLTESDKKLSSILYKSELTGGKYCGLGMDRGDKAILDIETYYRVKFSDNAKAIMGSDQHSTFSPIFDVATSTLTINVMDDQEGAGSVFTFSVSAAKPLELISNSLSQTDLDSFGDSPVSLSADLAAIDTKFGINLVDIYKGKTGEFNQYFQNENIIEIKVGQDIFRIKVLPKLENNAPVKSGFSITTGGVFVLDVEENPTLTEAQLKDAYSKFTKDINLDEAASIYKMLGSMNHPKLDMTKPHFKILVAGTDTDHAAKSFRVGLVGISEPDTNGDSTLVISWRPAKSIDGISDSIKTGDVVTNSIGALLPGSENPLIIMSAGLGDHGQITNFIKEVVKANPEFDGMRVGI